MAKAQRLPSGRWRVRWIDAAGKRRSETFSTEAAARAGLRRRQVETDNIRAGVARPKSDLTLREAAKAWLERRPPERYGDDESALRTHILPALGDYRLPAITEDAIAKFIRELEAKKAARVGQKKAAPLSRKTIKNVLVILAKMLGDLGYSHRIKYKVQPSSYRWIREPADVARFLAACEPEWFHVAAALSIYTGMRMGEVAGLRRTDVSFSPPQIRVARSYDGPTKGRRERFVPMPPQLASILRPWMLKHPGPLVVTKGGEMLRATTLSPYAARACKRAGLDRVTFQALRHTAASHLALQVALPLVGAMLGHQSPLTTAKYAHLDSEHLSRQERVHLNFEAPGGRVLQLEAKGSGGGHGMDTADEPQPRVDSK